MRAVIGAFVVLFAVVLQQRGGHSMEEVPDEEARFDAAGPSGYVLRAVEILLERAAKKGRGRVSNVRQTRFSPHSTIDIAYQQMIFTFSTSLSLPLTRSC